MECDGILKWESKKAKKKKTKKSTRKRTKSTLQTAKKFLEFWKLFLMLFNQTKCQWKKGILKIHELEWKMTRLDNIFSSVKGTIFSCTLYMKFVFRFYQTTYWELLLPHQLTSHQLWNVYCAAYWQCFCFWEERLGGGGGVRVEGL